MRRAQQKDFFLDDDAVESEIAEIDAKIKEVQALVARRNDLIAFKQLGEKLFGKTHKNDTNGNAAEVATEPVEGTTADFAYSVLQTNGALDLSGLLAQMRALRWVGSGDDAKDKKRIYAAIYKNEHFERNGEKWSMKG